MPPTVNISPNMLLPVPVPTVDPGPDWANNLYACLFSQIDSHDHSTGKGVQIQPDGLNIRANLPFQGNSATGLLTTSYNTQSSLLATLSFPYALYVSGGNLYYNNASNQIQITTPTSVNVTSSGISSPPASASFVSGVLVVDSNTATPGNIQLGSLLLGNNSVGTGFVTIQPGASTGSYTITLPTAAPGATSFLTEASSGQIGYISASGGITGSNIALSTISGSNIVTNPIITGFLETTLGVIPNSSGDAYLTAASTGGLTLLEGFGAGSILPTLQIPVNNAVTGNNPLMITRGYISSSGSILGGEGFIVTHPSTGVYDITFSNALAETPACVVTPVTTFSIPTILVLNGTSVQVVMSNASNTPINASFSFIAIGAFHNF